jgi:hypothetical protein
MAIKKTPKKNSQPVENSGEVVKKKRGRPPKIKTEDYVKNRKNKSDRKQRVVIVRKPVEIEENTKTHGAVKFLPEMTQKARDFLILTNGTDEQLADYLGVSDRTIYRWKAENLEFKAAIEEGKIGADIAVASSLLKRAKGYTPQPEIKEEIGTDAEGNEIKKITTTIKEMPPDVGAQKHWLSLRQPKIWRTPSISGIMKRFQSGELSAQDAAIEIESMGVALPDVLKMTLAKEMGLETAAEYKPIPVDVLEAAYLKGMAELEARTAGLAGRGLVIEREINEAKNGG